MSEAVPTKSYARIDVKLPLPDLIEVQLRSFERLKRDGLGDLFHEISPIESYNKGMKLYFPSRTPEAEEWELTYWFDEPKHTVEECAERDLTYASPLYVSVLLAGPDVPEPMKQDIFLGLIDEFADRLERRISEAIEQETSGIRRVDAALTACLDVFGSYRKLAKIFLVQAVGLGTAFEEKQWEIHDRFVAIVQQHLDEAVQEGDIPPQNTEIAAYAWMGALNEVVIRWIHTGEPDLEQALPDLRVFLLRSVGVPEGRIADDV